MCHDAKERAKFGWKMNCGFKIDMKNLVNFHLRTKKPWKFALWLIDSFCLKNIMFQLKNYRGVMCADNEVWCEI